MSNGKLDKQELERLAPLREGAEMAEEHKRSFTSDEIGLLPLSSFVGKIVLVESDAQLPAAMRSLHQE